MAPLFFEDYMKFEDLTEIRETEIQGETNWKWPKGDTGGWRGPTEDWNREHSVKYFKYLKKRNVIVTAGANCGLHARFYGKMFKRVYAFEPDPVNFYCLVHNAQYPNVIKMQMALGDKLGLVDIDNSNKGNVGSYTIKSGNLIPMITIDSLKLDECDFIQLDVEGYELNVCQGAINTITKFYPVISAENGKKCEGFLGSLGYRHADQSVSDAIFVKS